jgi:hypothetical protein
MKRDRTRAVACVTVPAATSYVDVLDAALIERRPA